jgi:hypothetical protein
MFPNNNLPKYGGLGLDYRASSSKDGHALNIYCSTNISVEMERSDAAEPPASIGKRLAYERSDPSEENPDGQEQWGFMFNYSDYSEQINEYFNENFGN